MRVSLAVPLLLLLAPGAAWAAGPADLQGQARALDGHTLQIGNVPVRLYGIKAPALDETCLTRRGRPYRCGVAAWQALSDLVRGRTVRCTPVRRDDKGRLVARCHIEWVDVGEQMVLIGRARADRTQGADYVRAENVARSLNEGMWKGRVVPPGRERKSD